MGELEILESYLEQTKGDLLQSQREKDIYASGESAAQTFVKMTSTGGSVIGPAYWLQQEEGRAPGAMPPLRAIERWIEIKGGPKYGIPIEAAYPIARKISREGTKAFREGGTGVVSDVINDDWRKELTRLLTEGIMTTVKSDIIKTWQ